MFVVSFVICVVVHLFMPRRWGRKIRDSDRCGARQLFNKTLVYSFAINFPFRIPFENWVFSMSQSLWQGKRTQSPPGWRLYWPTWWRTPLFGWKNIRSHNGKFLTTLCEASPSSFIVNISRHNLLTSADDTLVYDCESHFMRHTVISSIAGSQ
jgi:hypothetical protein